MATLYPGYQVFTPSAQPFGFGRFISGIASDDGDLDDSAHLMALAMACMDNCQFLAWHSIDPVNGGNYTGLGYVAPIATSNPWTFTGVVSSSGGFVLDGGNVIINTPTYIVGSTLFVGHDSAPSGVGHVVIDGTGSGAGSSITVQGGADIILTDPGGRLALANHATLAIDGTSTAQLDGIVTTTNEIVHSGTNAYESLRGYHIDDNTFSDFPLTITQADTFILDAVAVPSGSTTLALAFVAPTSNVPAIYRFTLRQQDKTSNSTVPGGVQFAFPGGLTVQFGNNGSTNTTKHQPAGVLLEWRSDAGIVCVVSVSDPNGVVTIV